MAEILNLQAKNYQNGNINYDWTELSSTRFKLAAGYQWANSNFVMCLRMDLPTPAKSVTLSFCNATGGKGSDQHLRYKFADAEDASLINASSDVPGDGSFTVKKGDWARNTITIDKALTAGTHYLYIWTDDSSNTNNAMWILWENVGGYNFIGTYEELEGFVNIKDSTAVRPYHLYVKTAEGPALLMLYAKTADGPVLLS